MYNSVALSALPPHLRDDATVYVGMSIRSDAPLRISEAFIT